MHSFQNIVIGIKALHGQAGLRGMRGVRTIVATAIAPLSLPPKTYSMKVELLHDETLISVRAAKDAVILWILWYNQKRMH
jgi:hypothetical protein